MELLLPMTDVHRGRRVPSHRRLHFVSVNSSPPLCCTRHSSTPHATRRTHTHTSTSVPTRLRSPVPAHTPSVPSCTRRLAASPSRLAAASFVRRSAQPHASPNIQELGPVDVGHSPVIFHIQLFTPLPQSPVPARNNTLCLVTPSSPTADSRAAALRSAVAPRPSPRQPVAASIARREALLPPTDRGRLQRGVCPGLPTSTYLFPARWH